MANDWGHVDWPFAREFLATLGDLPPATFDLVPIIAANPDATAMAVLRARPTDLAAIWLGLERAGCVWPLVPLGSWRGAARHLATFLAAHAADLAAHGMTTVDAARQCAGGFLTNAPAQSPLGTIVLHVLHRSQPDLFLEAPLSEMPRDLRAEHSGLLLRHLDDESWPSFEITMVEEELALVRDLVPRLTGPDSAGDRLDVLRAPALVAAMSFLNNRTSPKAQAAVRRIRAFDRGWFDLAHAATLYWLIERASS